MQSPQSFKHKKRLSIWPPRTQTIPDTRSMARLKDRGAASHIRRMAALHEETRSCSSFSKANTIIREDQ
eukprot:s5962_g6.t1